ncbi:MAG: lysophospholipid acyltransferase family protein [Pseudobdellovibrio sp.]
MKKSFSVLKSFVPLFITLYYLALTYVKPRYIRNIKQSWARTILKFIGYEVHISGSPQAKGPIIYVGTHMSYLDILVLIVSQPDIVFLAKKEVRSWPIIGAAAHRVGTLFVNRDSKEHRLKIRNEIGEILNQTKSHVVVFPSGTTTLYEEKTWKKGMFEVAQEFNVPVQLFKISYDPYFESSYVNKDSLLEKMSLQLSLKNKKAFLSWLDVYTIHNPEIDCEHLRLQIQNDNLK